MPFKSEKQRKWMHANEPEMADKWEKEEESVTESDLGLTYKKGKTVKVKHKKSGKELVIVDKPNVRKEYEKIGYFAEGTVNEATGVEVARRVTLNLPDKKTGMDIKVARKILDIDAAYSKTPSLQKQFRKMEVKKMMKMMKNYYWEALKKKESLGESGLQYRMGVKRYGKEGMTKIQSAAGSGADHAEIGAIKDKYDKKKKKKKKNEAVNEANVIQKIDKLAKRNKYGTVDGTRMNGKTAREIMAIFKHPKMNSYRNQMLGMKSHELADLTVTLVKALKIKVESVDEERDYKAEYKKYGSSTKAKKYRAELNQYNRKKGTYGNGDGKDASHRGGKIVGFEAQSKNRGRAEKSRLKKESVNEGGTINVEPNWEGMWRFFKRMAITNPRDWKKMERTLGSDWLKIDKMAQQKGWKSESVSEAGTKSIDGKELLDFLMKRFKMSKSKAIATMKKHKMDLSFLKKESVNEGGMGILSTDQADVLQGIVMRNKSKNLKAILSIVIKNKMFKDVDKKELLGYIDGARQFVKYMKSHPMESINEAKMTHVLTKDIGKKKMKDLVQFIFNVLDLAPNKDFRLSSNGKILSVNVDKINSKSIQNIKRRYGVDLKESINESAVSFWQDMFRPGPLPKQYINQLIKKKGELPSKSHIKKIYKDNGNPSSSELAKSWKLLTKEKYVRAASGMWRWNADFTGWESVSEGFSSLLVKKAVDIAKKMAGNMTGAVKKIEKIKKGLSDDSKVKAALRKANESVNEEITNWQGGYDSEFKFRIGQLVKDINPDCPHVGSEGEVTNVTEYEVTYTVRNNGKTYKVGDELTKTKEQLIPLSIEEGLRKVIRREIKSINEKLLILEFDKYSLNNLLDSKLKKRLERTINVIGGKVDAVGDDYIKFRMSGMDLAKLPSVITKLDRNKNVWIGDRRKTNIWDRKQNIDKLNEGSTIPGAGGRAHVDDGPRYWWGDQGSYEQHQDKIAGKLGWEVVDWIMKKNTKIWGNADPKSTDYAGKFDKNLYRGKDVDPGGPTGAVSYAPTGIMGKKGGTQVFQVDNMAKGFSLWEDHIKFILKNLGWEIIDYMGAENVLMNTLPPEEHPEDTKHDRKSEKGKVTEGSLGQPLPYSSTEAQKHVDRDVVTMSKFIGKASQQVIKTMMDGVKGGRYDAMDLQRGFQYGPAKRTHYGEMDFIQQLWLKVRDGFRRYSKNRKLR